MTALVPTIEPATIVAGDSLTWKRTLADYPAGTWSLKYRLINANGAIDVTSTASGTDHLVTVAATESAGWAAGKYSMVSYVEQGATRITLGSATVIIQPNLAVLATRDVRTAAAKIVDQLRAAYIAYTESNSTVLEYEIAGRHMKYRSGAEILEQLSFWESRVNDEKRAERVAAGLGAGNKLLVRFR